MPSSDEHSAADDQALHDAKALLREAVLLRRETRAESDRLAQDQARFDLIRTDLTPRLPGLDVAALYLSSGVEPGTLQLISWLATHDITVLLPVLTTVDGIRREGPDWAPYGGPDQLRIGRRGIMEPTTEPMGADALARAKIIFSSALAASPAGERLGRGGGWYDRALHHAARDSEVWALLNDDEVLEVIPTQDWDRPVHVLVTPTRRIATPSPAAE